MINDELSQIEITKFNFQVDHQQRNLYFEQFFPCYLFPYVISRNKLENELWRVRKQKIPLPVCLSEINR